MKKIHVNKNGELQTQRKCFNFFMQVLITLELRIRQSNYMLEQIHFFSHTHNYLKKKKREK